VTPAPLLLLAAIGLVAGLLLGPRFPRFWVVATVAGAAGALGAALRVLGGSAEWEWRGPLFTGGESLHLRLDALSALFLALLAVVGGAGAVYARTYWSDHGHPDSAPRGRRWWCGLVLAMGFVLLSSNGLQFLVGWELFTISAFFLVTLDREHRSVRAAGWLYLAASHVGTLCLFAFFAALAARTGSWDLGPLHDRAELAPLFWLALLGFGVKGGVFPFHVWLPSAHASAPSHVSAIMSGVAIKMGLYGLVRFSGWLPVPAAAGWVVITLGAVGAVAGIAFALVQSDLKRLLAYCSVENVGIILLGLGGALLAAAHGDAPWGRLALAGALLHVWNHGLFKVLLFLGAGSVLHATGTREMSRLGGLWRTMPWTAALFALGAAAIAGLPPLNGFVSEWLIYLGLFDAVLGRGPAAAAALPAAILLGVAGALALATFVKASAVVFLGAPRTPAAAHAHDCGPGMWVPMAGFAALCVAIGLLPALVAPAVARAVGVWHPAWSGSTVIAPLTALGPVQAALAVGLVVGALALGQWVRARRLRRALTWDCGYAAPSARMQYTAGSFGATGGGWFAWLLRPERSVRRPRGTFPTHATRTERFPETVLERLVAPVGAAVLHAAAAARRLQHGHLQYYIAYVAAGVTALGLLVLWDGSS